MMLSVPIPTRVPLGTAQVGGQKIEIFLSPEWARYIQSLNTQVQASAASLAQSNAQAALLADAMEEPDVFPGPQGPIGMQGDPGLALFLLQDDRDDQAMLVPPSVDGVYVPLNSKDASGGVPGLTQFKLNLKNAAGTIISWFTTTATAARTWTLPDKSGTVALTSDFATPPDIGNTTPAGGSFTALTASAGFGCNGKTAQSAAASGGTLAGVIAALVANGILSS
jgi:hypothetical protein